MKFSLLAKFSLVSFFLTAAIAMLLAWGIQRHLEKGALDREAENAAEQVSSLLNGSLSLADFAGPLSPSRYAEIDTLIRKNLIGKHIVRIKLWTRDGLLLYSDEKDLIGRRFPISEELQEALEGKLETEISSLKKEENVGERERFKQLIEVYVPLRPNDSPQVAGAYEIYHDMVELNIHIAEARRFLWGSVTIGFIILYGSLFTLVRKASRELILRNEENARLFALAQEQLEQLTALYDLSRALADAANETEIILNMVTRRAVETIHVTFARVFLLDGADFVVSEVYPARIMGHDLEMGQRKVAADYACCHRVLVQNQPLILHKDSTELSEHERQGLFIDLAKTLCLVPLRLGERTMGLLILAETRSEKREPFTAEKLRLAQNIGAQIASALNRVELFIELERAYLQTILTLANAVDAKDNYTADHSESLSAMAIAIGRESGLAKQKLDNLRYGAILHDIGKIGVPDAILNKPSSLNADEWRQMRQHPVIGWQILSPVPRLKSVAEIVRHHHERYDGKGYPDGLAGEAIPLGARILTIVDSYNAMIDVRVYKAARSHEKAAAELRKCASAQFDPRLVEIFLRLPEGERNSIDSIHLK